MVLFELASIDNLLRLSRVSSGGKVPCRLFSVRSISIILPASSQLGEFGLPEYQSHSCAGESHPVDVVQSPPLVLKYKLAKAYRVKNLWSEYIPALLGVLIHCIAANCGDAGSRSDAPSSVEYRESNWSKTSVSGIEGGTIGCDGAFAEGEVAGGRVGVVKLGVGVSLSAPDGPLVESSPATSRK